MPKETTRRKIISLIKKKHIKKGEKNRLFWEPDFDLKESLPILKEPLKKQKVFDIRKKTQQDINSEPSLLKQNTIVKTEIA